MFGQGAQTKSPTVGAERGLRPMTVIRVQARETFEASPNVLVKASNGSAVVAGGHGLNRENHLAEGSEATQELQGDLGVGELAQGLKQVRGFVDSFLRVRVAELRASDRSAKQLKVAVPNYLEVSREGAHVHRGSSFSSKNSSHLSLK